YIKKINRSLILGKIIEHGKISRAELSKITALTRATISVQVADLLDEKLIIETQQEHNNVGRRPIMLSLNPETGYALGIDLDYKQITFTVSGLLGYPIHTDTIELTTSDYEMIVRLLIKHIKEYQDRYSNSPYGLVGIVIGIHGLVTKDEIIHFVPQHEWYNKNLKSDLQKEVSIDISIENNSNLCAFAERVYKHHQSENLLCVTLYSGIGLGIMINGELLKGYDGYAGEMGHMIIVPDGKTCKCGNHGCWELYASEYNFFKTLSKKKEKPALSYNDVKKWMNERDATTCSEMEQLIKYLSIGLNNIINLYNPEILVLNSELLQLDPTVSNKVENLLNSTVSHYRELLISELGKKACVMGACSLAIKNFLEIPELKLDMQDKSNQKEYNSEIIF
ncbi:ROK family transcriptional regulator, partial [Priestia megaterium]|uniref:ROK family transcriptional regulator n=1 Tax=Priestia megaterium TaxID=1404 RepID=UPI002FFDD075